jgi:N-acetylglucosaminyldiphosphoundecaprenol N-acetyl-beta-D-mannosaminyltransferase
MTTSHADRTTAWFDRVADRTVGVIVVTTDRTSLVRRALHSVLAQRDVDVRVVVVDDDPNHEARAMVSSLDDPRVGVLRPRERLGAAAARNAGASYIETPWVAFLDDVDVWAPDLLASHFAGLESSPGARWTVSGCAAFIDDGPSGRLVAHRSIDRAGSPPFHDVIRASNVVPTTSSVMVERELFLEVGGFRADPQSTSDLLTGLPTDVEWDLWRRLDHASDVALVDRPLVGFPVDKLDRDNGRRPSRTPRLVERFDHWRSETRIPLDWRADALSWLPDTLQVSDTLQVEALQVDRSTGGPPLVDIGWPSLPGIHQVSAVDAVAHVMNGISRGVGGTVVTPNLHHLWMLERSDELAAAYRDASLVVADGAPLVWASRLRRSPLPERVAGSDLVWFLAAAAARRHHRLFLLGGRPGAADATAAELESAFPGLVIAGTACPPVGFDTDPVQMDGLIAALRSSAPDLVYVGLGAPKQELVASRLLDAVPSTWFVGVGGSFEMAAGQLRRSPRWMSSLGLEWCYRMMQEPRRLATRYLRDVPVAVRLLTGSTLAGRRTSRVS